MLILICGIGHVRIRLIVVNTSDMIHTKGGPVIHSVAGLIKL